MTQAAGLVQRLARAIRMAVLCSLAVSPRLAFADGGAQASAVLEWDPSIDPTVVAYSVYYGAASGNYTNVVHAGNTNQVTISNLVPGVTYYAAVTALNAVGLESDFSNEASYSVPAPGPSPTLVITRLGDGFFAIGGTGTPGQTYTIQYSAQPLPSLDWQTLGTATADASGSFVLGDVAGPSPRFYRAVYP